jgi:glycosyltransferase involved in cell wall biosynthesis
MTQQATRSQIPQDPVDIVLGCYNSARWIDQFIESLQGQGAANWRLITRDDGSKDETQTVLKGWQERLGSRMLLLDPDSSQNLGMSRNYDALLSATTADWVMMADPDDVWLPHHLSLTLMALKQAEAKFGADVPICVCTDAIVVDGQLNSVADSFWRWSKVRPLAVPSLTRMSIESVALGTTMIINRALLNKALPLPDATNPDWWLALVGVAFGRFIALPEPSVKYRRHGENATNDPLSVALGKRLIGLSKTPAAVRGRLDFLLHQAGRLAAIFVRRYEDTLDAANVTALRRLSVLADAHPITKRLWIVQHGFWFSSIEKNIGLLMFS